MSATTVVSVTFGGYMVVLLAGCSASSAGDDGGPPPARPYHGAVHVLFDGGTRRVDLTLDEGYPQLELARRFLLRVAGSADHPSGAGPVEHAVQLSIDPVKETPSYEFPRDRQQLAVEVQRGGQPARVGAVTGFLKIDAFDEDQAPGSAVLSVTLADAAGYSMVELDLVFGGPPGPAGD